LSTSPFSVDLEEKDPDLAKKVSETMGKFEKKIEKLDQDGKDYIGKVGEFYKSRM
jgi:ABC-type Zn uptake system ZnuABC Zn-binding protein ZnuA